MDIVNMKPNKLATMINDELKKDTSLSINKVCEKLGLKASSVKTKFRRSGYIYNKELRMYEKVLIPPTKFEEVSQVQDKVNTNTIQTQANDKPRETVDMALNNNIGKTIPNTVEPLTESEILAIRKLLKQVQDNDKPVQVQGNFEVNYKYGDDEKITRNIKVSKNLNEQFLEFTKTLPPGTRILDVYNTMFEEFLNKYFKNVK